MRNVIYSMGMSLDGYIVDPEGRFDWSVPSEEEFAASLAEVRGLHAHLLGRKLYETMLYWDDPAVLPELDAAEREFAEVWNALPKVVFSTTLDSVQGSGLRLATGTLVEEIVRLRTEPGEGDIAIGGATLAAAAADLDLIDEYHVRVSPVLLGGGIPFFAHHGRRSDLDLVDTRRYASGVVDLIYRRTV